MMVDFMTTFSINAFYQFPLLSTADCGSPLSNIGLKQTNLEFIFFATSFASTRAVFRWALQRFA